MFAEVKYLDKPLVLLVQGRFAVRTGEQAISAMLEAALGYAARGWAVFPCNSLKEPLVKNGVNDATTNPEQIKNWWARHPGANIGCDTSNWLVIDLDPGSDEKSLADAVGETGATQLRQLTPRGGRHLIYALGENERVANSTSKIADHIDVRSFHGYILLAPSRTADGVYSWESEGTPAYRSDELYRACSVARERDAKHDTWTIAPDLPENIEACARWLSTRAKVSVKGSGGNANAYATAAMCKSYGISEATALDLMWEHWAPRCSPAWYSHESLETVVTNAYEYNTSPPGNITAAYKIAQSAGLFQPVQSTLANGGVEERAGRFRIVDRDGLETVEPPTWLIPDFLPENSYAILFGARGTFKTFVALDVALSVATGSVLGSTNWRPSACGPVLYAAGEGRSNIKQRVRAWEHYHNSGARANNFKLIDPVPRISDALDDFVKLAEARSATYKLIVLDTIGRSMQGTNENYQENASAFTALVEALQRKFGCAVLALHHTGQSDQLRARGSSVFEADADTVVRLDRDGKANTVDLVMTKQKDAAEWEYPRRVKLAECLGSLVVVPSEEAAPMKTKEQVAVKKLFHDVVFEKLLETAVLQTLDENKLKSWSSLALAERLANRKELKLGSSALKTKLKDWRESERFSLAHCYDADNKRWRWAEKQNAPD